MEIGYTRNMTVDELITAEVARQDVSWGTQDYVPDDRWIEIVLDEFNDLRWAVRIRQIEKEDHDIDHELIQTIATLYRWYRARNVSLS